MSNLDLHFKNILNQNIEVILMGVMNQKFSDKFASLIHYFLMKTYFKLGTKSKTSTYWWNTWNKSNDVFSNNVVSSNIHGYSVFMNYGYTYPLASRMFPSYNNPLIELTYQTFQAKNSALTIIDIGAAIGDTILLLYSNCPQMISNFYCVDGDKEFFIYLQKNLGHFKEGNLIFAMLSNSKSMEKELIRTYKGTASAQGDIQVPAQPLDLIMQNFDLQTIDLIKIDVDGLDGKVLEGSRNLIQQYKPSIIFEWHPILCKKTGNSWIEHFEILIKCGYNRFIWFTKFGEFSHFTHGYNEKVLNDTADVCLRNQLCDDWHYDVIALHQDSLIDSLKLAELSFARKRTSKF